MHGLASCDKSWMFYDTYVSLLYCYIASQSYQTMVNEVSRILADRGEFVSTTYGPRTSWSIPTGLVSDIDECGIGIGMSESVPGTGVTLQIQSLFPFCGQGAR